MTNDDLEALVVTLRGRADKEKQRGASGNFTQPDVPGNGPAT